jgi:hypothetical protein
MRSRNVEVVHRISSEVTVLCNIRGRSYIKIKAEAALVRFTPRLQAHFHHAFAHGGLIAKGRNVPNRVNQKASSASTG